MSSSVSTQLDKRFVFHLKREFFELIWKGYKTCEYRFEIPQGLFVGSPLRFDLGYKSLDACHAHIFAQCTLIDRLPLRDCTDDVFRCYGLDRSMCVGASPLIYRIRFFVCGRR